MNEESFLIVVFVLYTQTPQISFRLGNHFCLHRHWPKGGSRCHGDIKLQQNSELKQFCDSVLKALRKGTAQTTELFRMKLF